MDRQHNSKIICAQARLKRKLVINGNRANRLRSSGDVENMPHQTSDGIVQREYYSRL